MIRTSYNYCIINKDEFMFEINYHNKDRPSFIVYKSEDDKQFFRINTKYEFLDNGNIKIFKRDATNEYDIGVPRLLSGSTSDGLINCTVDQLYHFAYNSWKMGLNIEPVNEEGYGKM